MMLLHRWGGNDLACVGPSLPWEQPPTTIRCRSLLTTIGDSGRGARELAGFDPANMQALPFQGAGVGQHRLFDDRLRGRV